MLTINLRPLPVRILFFLFVVAGLGVLAWIAAGAAIGESVLIFVQRNPNLSPEARLKGVDAAAGYGARDPLAHLGRGNVYLAAANDEQGEERLATALAELQTAARLNPEDYRAWMALGRALDRAAKPAEARTALDRAIALAPKHFDPRWALGNHLLRAGEREAAFAQFREAMAGRSVALPLVFDYAWDAFQGDARAIVAAIAPTGESRAETVKLLIARNLPADALAIWRELPNRTEAEAKLIAASFFEARQMNAAYEAWATLPAANRPAPDEGSLLANGDFEKQPALNAPEPFLTWHIARTNGVKVSLDRKGPFSGGQSFRIGFEVRENVPMSLLMQTVPVKASTNYSLSYATKTEELQGWSMLSVEVINAGSGNRLAAAAPLPNGTHDWKAEQINFSTDAKTEVVTIRFHRTPCADPPCLLTGRVLLDAFKLR
ncbi:MAG TPA: tetratricopeptide repeat protein [Blastocatellia bacterium]|nr:tetratricopeptide repeat protein [Blastocatellia bacterium]HMV82096.1 tetratricopeptide repeat protein [Blastocatellia bacterium]HMX24424.1 tetratricopeptide repeat protein [Blastocatellia bacterium]HMZ22762.1 tetratricopeptide repeat protein [Blastocatellia bacterium]HNG29115.1 tetratricopeptide repeat protein [Blastocatellia bacterium]